MFSSVVIDSKTHTNNFVKKLQQAASLDELRKIIKMFGKQHDQSFKDFAELKHFFNTLNESPPSNHNERMKVNFLCMYVAIKLKPLIVPLIGTFYDLVQLPKPAINGILCHHHPMLKKYVTTPEQLAYAIHQMGPGDLYDMVAENVNPAWLRSLVVNEGTSDLNAAKVEAALGKIRDDIEEYFLETLNKPENIKKNKTHPRFYKSEELDKGIFFHWDTYVSYRSTDPRHSSVGVFLNNFLFKPKLEKQIEKSVKVIPVATL